MYGSDEKYVTKQRRFDSYIATFPYELVLNCVLPFTGENNITVLDPFMGSGTTGMVCRDLDVNFIGVELDECYYNIALENTQ